MSEKLKNIIPESKLKIGWYSGKGRNADVAYWTGKTFLTIGRKFDQYLIKDEGYFVEMGFGCFQPLNRLCDTKVEKMFEKD